MKEYLNFLHQLSIEIYESLPHFETMLKKANSKDKDKLQKLNLILDNLKKLASLLATIDKSSLPEIHKLISITLPLVNEKKIYSALRRLKLNDFVDFFIQYQTCLTDFRNHIVKLNDCINDYQAFTKINLGSNKNINTLQSILSLWASDSSNLLFASDEEYILQLKEVEKNRNTIQILITKENAALKAITTKKENISLIFLKKHDIELIQQYLKIDSESLAPVKDDFQHIIDITSDMFAEFDSLTLHKLIEERNDILYEAQSRLYSFREDILIIIDKLRLKKIDWEANNQKYISSIEDKKKNIVNLKEDLSDIENNIQLHIDRMLAIIGTKESEHSFPPQLRASQAIEPLENSIRAYKEKSQSIDVALNELNDSVNLHANNEDYRLSTVLARQQKSLNSPYFSLNYATQHKIKMADEHHQQTIDQITNHIHATKSDFTSLNHSIAVKMKLMKELEYQILIKYKRSYSAINDSLFSDIKNQLIASEDFMSLDCHRLASMEKSPLIDEYINSIQDSRNLEELMAALDSNPGSESSLSLRQNTGLSKVFGVSLGGFIYGLFHHQHKSTCDEYASKLKTMAEKLINDKIEVFKDKKVNFSI